jgi:hypothetical protein
MTKCVIDPLGAGRASFRTARFPLAAPHRARDWRCRRLLSGAAPGTKQYAERLGRAGSASLEPLSGHRVAREPAARSQTPWSKQAYAIDVTVTQECTDERAANHQTQ